MHYSFTCKLITVAAGTGRVVFLYFGRKLAVERVSTAGYYVIKQEFVRPRWPCDMRPSARAEKYMCVIVIR